MSQEIERIKNIISEEIEREMNMARKEFPLRLNHIKEHIFFKIDNPNYIRKNKV